jgi:Co/Zn/Cd efflux system component
MVTEAISRLIHPPAVDGGPVIAVAVAGINDGHEPGTH